MRITPLDIRKQEFRKTMRGLDGDEVHAFLGTVADEYEAVLSDNKRLREHIVQLEERVQEFKSMETNLRNTLMTAEKITAEAKENARREADLIVRGAEVEATQSAEAIRAHTQQLRREILELKKHKDNYITRLRTLLDSHRNVVDGFEEDFAEVDREIEEIGKKVEEDVQTPPPASRMSRERIEEDFAHEEPADKVTWGDDQPSEEVERPQVPKPGEWDKQKPETDEQTEQEEETASDPQLDFGPVGVVSDEEVMNVAQSAAGDAEEEYHDDRVEMTEEQIETEALAKDVVAHSLEERMYPDAHINGDPPPAGGAQQQGPQAAAPGQAPVQQGSPTAFAPRTRQPVQPEMPQSRQQQGPTATAVEPGPQASDDWKSYEVKESKQDWSSYEVPRQEVPEARQPAPQSSAQPQAAQAVADEGPTDTEVEEALSGLNEMAGDKTAQPRAAQPAPQQPVQPQAAQPQAAQPQAEVTDENGEADDKKWSIEELRRNLTNIDRDG